MRRHSRKGQNRVVGEMLLFAVGIIILSYIIMTFGTAQAGINKLSVNDQLQNVADYIKSAVTEISNKGARSNITIQLPIRVSGEEYIIRLNKIGTSPEKNALTVLLARDLSVNVTEELFNIGIGYNIEDIEPVELRSSSVYYVVSLNPSKILKMEYYR